MAYKGLYKSQRALNAALWLCGPNAFILPSDKNNVVLGNYLANNICMSQCSYINTNEYVLIEEQMG